MTVDEIDVLEGRELDSAVARAKCWAGDEMFPRYSSDSGLSLELLLGCDQWFDVCNRPNEKPPVCYINLGDTVEAYGETFPVAACRAFLKLKRLESDRNVARNCLGATDRGENGRYGEIGQ